MINIDVTHNFTFAGAVHTVYHCNKGDGLVRHSHEYAHVTSCHNGRIIIRKEGKEIFLDKHSKPVILSAGEWHEIEALEDGTVFENIFGQGMY